jgi:hypothetical protein
MRGWLALLVVLSLSGTAAAHDLRPGVLALTEVSPGEYALRFLPPVDSRGDAMELSLALPAGCTRTTPTHLHCDGPLGGELGVGGMHGTATRTLLVLKQLGGERREWVLDPGRPRIDLGRSPPSGIRAWIRIGIAHIWTGYDHLAFVLGLLLVLHVQLNRRLLATITAFTLAHSLTLALAVLGVARVHANPVEACIALSVLLVAREGLHERQTAIRRWPWIAAAVFGCVHGLGFASALAQLGLPRASLARSLVSFNVGVELGQLAVVGAVVAVVAVGRRLVGERRILRVRIHRAACYGLGALAAWWLLHRVVELACGGG